jgi:hypothetical protein
MNGIEDDYKALHQLVKDRYSDKFIAAIDHALAFNAQDRPKSIAEWRAEFDFDEGEVLTMPAVALADNGSDIARTAAGADSINETVSEAPTVNATTGDTLSTLVMTKSMRFGQLMRGNKFLVAGIVITATALVAVIMLLLHGPGYETLQQEAGMAVEEPAAVKDAMEDTAAATPALTETAPAAADTEDNGMAATAAETPTKPAPAPVGAVQIVAAAASNAAKTPATDTAAKTPAADTAAMAPATDTAAMAPAADTAAKTPATDTAAKAPATDTAAKAPAADTKADADKDQKRIDKLLRQAKADIKALRLMTPKGNNAYERYQEVLSLDKDNKAATTGIRSLSDRYLKLSYGALKDGRIRLARVYLWRAEQLTPGSPAVVRARNRIRAATGRQTAKRQVEQRTEQSVGQQVDRKAEQQAADQEDEGGFVDNVMNWFRENSEGTEEAPKESPTSQNVRKGLGGR